MLGVLLEPLSFSDQKPYALSITPLTPHPCD